jgi:hypothetical protein
VHQVNQLLVFSILVVWDNRDAIIELETETVSGIVHNCDIFQISIGNNSQILDVNALLCLQAVVSE